MIASGQNEITPVVCGPHTRFAGLIMKQEPNAGFGFGVLSEVVLLLLEKTSMNWTRRKCIGTEVP